MTGKSTAKIPSQHVLAYGRIRRKFGESGAQIYADANQAGMRQIFELAASHGIDCRIERKPAFTFTQAERHVADIEEEAELARNLGLPASTTLETGLPFPVLAAMRWDDQAQFHPVDYVKGLAETLPGDGCHGSNNRGHQLVIDRSRRTGRRSRPHVVMANPPSAGQTGPSYTETIPHASGYDGARPALANSQWHVHQYRSPRRSLRGHVGPDGDPG